MIHHRLLCDRRSRDLRIAGPAVRRTTHTSSLLASNSVLCIAMKQATRKRPAAPGSSPKKRLKPLAGTAAEPIAIDLDDADNRASPIDVDAEDSGEAPVDPGPSQPSKVSGQRRKLPSSGPSTAEPLNINQPNFDVRATFTNVKPHIILKDPDLDLLYFKRMSEC